MAEQKRKGGFGKAFLGGFLGAVVVLALAVGGIALAQGGLSQVGNAVKSGDYTAQNASADDSTTSADDAQSDTTDAENSDNTATTQDDNQATSSDQQSAFTKNNSGTSSSALANASAIELPELVAEKCLPSVVSIYIYTYETSYTYGGYGFGFGPGSGSSSTELELSSLGSGVILSSDGYVVTNYHVIDGADAIKVSADGTEYDATVVGTDESSDLAVIKLDLPAGTTLTPIEVGDSDNLTVGQWVMTIGSPFGYEQSVATGVVSAQGRSTLLESDGSIGYQAYINLIQTDASINPGNSGGALVDAQGKLIGINTLITSYSGNYSGVGFAIPANYAIAIAEEIINGETPSHASLGVSMMTVSSSNAQRYGLTVTSGAYISTVYDGGAAATAGIQAGDVITAVDDETITSASDLVIAIRSHNVGDTVTITLVRDGETLTGSVTLQSDSTSTTSSSSSNSSSSSSSESGSSSSGSGSARSFN